MKNLNTAMEIDNNKTEFYHFHLKHVSGTRAHLLGDFDGFTDSIESKFFGGAVAIIV